MTASRPTVPRHASTERSNRLPFLVGLLIVIAIAIGGGIFLATRGSGTDKLADPAASEQPSTQQTPPANATPDAIPEDTTTPAQQLLATVDDPQACAVSFVGDGITADPVLETAGILYQALPTPESQGQVFAGWYPSPESASALNQAERINGAKQAECSDRQVTLYGAWVSPQKNTEEAAEIPILMYHQFTTNPEGEDNWLSANYVYVNDFDAHMAYIKEQKFYLPTWRELSDFIDGKLYLPSHSVIVTDDDADPTWVELAAPIVEKYQIPTTSFVIAIDGAGPPLSQYVLKRSHTYDMHSAGEDGKGRMVNWDADAIAADLEKSAEVLGGAKEIVAYPYGHNNETAHQGLTQAGFFLGRTIDQGYVSIGTDKMALPCIRMNYGMNVDALAAAIG